MKLYFISAYFLMANSHFILKSDDFIEKTFEYANHLRPEEKKNSLTKGKYDIIKILGTLTLTHIATCETKSPIKTLLIGGSTFFTLDYLLNNLNREIIQQHNNTVDNYVQNTQFNYVNKKILQWELKTIFSALQYMENLQERIFFRRQN
jgi:hypothetical protein